MNNEKALLARELNMYHCAGGHTRAAQARWELERAGFRFDNGAIYYPDGVKLSYTTAGDIVPHDWTAAKTAAPAPCGALLRMRDMADIGAPRFCTAAAGAAGRCRRHDPATAPKRDKRGRIVATEAAPKTAAPVDVLDVLAKLPAESYIWDVVRPGVSLIRRGVRGHYPLSTLPAELAHIKAKGDYPKLHEAGRAFVDDMNTRAGVTPAQAQAMQIGSMFGWEVPGADPDRHTTKTKGA